MGCSTCGAPLPPNTLTCPFCKSLNDIDLKGIALTGDRSPHPDRRCPRCEVHMVSIQISAGEKTHIERCDECLGIFFDPSELECLLDASVSHVHRIDMDRLKLLAESQDSDHDHIVKYVKCPVCEELMNRRHYGPRSAVIVDTCKAHGVWLDGGELRKLLNWTKAGGELYRTKREDEEERTRKRRQGRLPPQGLSSVSWSDEYDDSPTFDMVDVGRAVGLLLRWLF